MVAWQTIIWQLVLDCLDCVQSPFSKGTLVAFRQHLIAQQQRRGLPEVACEAGAPIIAESSLKAALDLDWDVSGAQQQALRIVLDTLEAVEGWLDTYGGLCQADAHRAASLAVAHQVYAQDVTTTSDGTPTCARGALKIAASVSKMPRCATGAKVGVCSLMATSAMYCTIWTVA